MDKVQELSSKWMDLISQDHHKDRDCHFYVMKCWSYGKTPFYRAEHYGYIYHDVVCPDRLSYEEAYNDLVDLLETAIKNYKHEE